MDQHISPAIAAALFAPFVLLLLTAVVYSLSQSRRNRTDSVVATWGELRITKTFLILGYHRNARRIPLAGLKATVSESGSPADGPDRHQVHVTIEGLASTPVRRSQPYSYGTIGAARMFAILVNRAGHQHPVPTEVPIPDWVDLPRAA